MIGQWIPITLLAVGLLAGIAQADVPGSLVVTTPSPLPQGELSIPYAQALVASSGISPYTWSLTAGSLPKGLVLSSGGALSGTPASSGAFQFTVQVIDIAGSTASEAFGLTIVDPPSILYFSPPNGTGGLPYAYTLTVSGGAPPYSWSSGAIPPGLILAANGVISGTPVTPGQYRFTAVVTDALGGSASRAFSLTVLQPATISSPSPLPIAGPGTAYSYALSAYAGTAPYAWSVTAGSLPSGLSLSPAGMLSGVPSTPGTNNFQVRVLDSVGSSDSVTFSLTVAAQIVISPTSPLPNAIQGSVYSQTLSASGGLAPYYWRIASGALPSGLGFVNSPITGLPVYSLGVITGTPADAGTFTFSVQVVDNRGITATATYSLAVSPQPLSMDTRPLFAWTVGIPYSWTISASGGAPPYAWALTSGTLPDGVLLGSRNGQLSGTPTKLGSSTFAVQVTDSAGSSISAAYTLSVITLPSIMTPSPLPTGTAGVPYSVAFTASGGTPPYYGWTTGSGAPPAGLALGPTGILTGTPTTAGTFTFPVQVRDSSNYPGAATFQLTIAQAPLTVVGSPILWEGSLGTMFYQALTAAGGTPPYTWSISAGSLPAGLSLTSAGVISGTPRAAGAYTFSARVTDFAGTVVTTAMTLPIASAPLSFVSPPDQPWQRSACRLPDTACDGRFSAVHLLLVVDQRGRTHRTDAVRGGSNFRNAGTGRPILGFDYGH